MPPRCFPTGTPLDVLVREVRELTSREGERLMRLGVMIGAERGDMARKVNKLLDDIEWAEAGGPGHRVDAAGAQRLRLR